MGFWGYFWIFYLIITCIYLYRHIDEFQDELNYYKDKMDLFNYLLVFIVSLFWPIWIITEWER